MIIVYCKKKEKNNTGSTILTLTHMNIVTDSSNLYQLTKQTGSSVKASDMYLWDVSVLVGILKLTEDFHCFAPRKYQGSTLKWDRTAVLHILSSSLFTDHPILNAILSDLFMALLNKPSTNGAEADTYHLPLS